MEASNLFESPAYFPIVEICQSFTACYLHFQDSPDGITRSKTLIVNN